MTEADEPKKNDKEKEEQEIPVIDLTGKNDWALHRRDKEVVARMKAAESKIRAGFLRRQLARERREEKDADQDPRNLQDRVVLAGEFGSFIESPLDIAWEIEAGAG